MDIKNDRIWILMTRVLSDEASVPEKRELRSWIEEKPEHKEFFEKLRNAWTRKPGDLSVLFDHQRGLDKLRGKIDRDRFQKKNFKINPSPAEKGNRFRPLKVAASILLLTGLLSVFLTVRFWDQPVSTYATAELEQRIVTLPDGSQVRLNAHSRVSFPKDFAGSVRRIELDGEAFFDVKENPRKPFVIRTDAAVVKVLGTAFSVKEQAAAGKVMVVVKEGVVSFRSRKEERGEGVKIRKGYLGFLSAGDGSINIEEVNTENYFSWINGRLSFENIPLNEILIQLDRIYGVNNVIKDSSLASLRLTAHTRKVALAEVLQMISHSLNITYRKDGNTIIWQGGESNSPSTAKKAKHHS